jgi:hypothetical protein
MESGGAPYRSHSLAAVDLRKGGTTERALEGLLDLGELERTERGRYRVVDPLFARWLLRQRSPRAPGPERGDRRETAPGEA